MRTSCAMCSRDDLPITREHVFARWLVERVRGARLLPSGAAHGPVALRLSRITVPVCGECNGGWMSLLEERFRRAVFGRARSGPLPAADRVTLSRWFTKTAALVAEAQGATLLDRQQRARLMVGMPDGVEVHLSRRRRPPQPIDHAVDLVAVGEGNGPRARSVAVQVGDVVGHVAPAGSLSGRHGTRLWPLRSHALRWETVPVRSIARGSGNG